MSLTNHGHDVREELVELDQSCRCLLSHAQSTSLTRTCSTSCRERSRGGQRLLDEVDDCLMLVKAQKMQQRTVGVHTNGGGTRVGETFAHLDDTNNVDHLLEEDISKAKHGNQSRSRDSRS